jgi:hypothetical protein
MMSEKQATRIALFSCLRKRARTREECIALAAEQGLYYYCCPFSQMVHHWHLTAGQKPSRSWGKILRAAQALGCLGPCEDEL